MSESSDRALLDLIRRHGPLTVAEMARAAGRDGDGGPQPADAAGRLGDGRAPGRARGPGPPEAHLPGERRGPQAARPELRRPGRRPLGRDDARRSRTASSAGSCSAGSPSGWPSCIARRSPATSGKAGWSSSARSSTTGGSRPRSPAATAAIAAGPQAALLPLLRAGRGRPRHLRHGTEDVREGARPRPAAQPVPARRPPLVRLRGQADRRARPA